MKKKVKILNDIRGSLNSITIPRKGRRLSKAYLSAIFPRTILLFVGKVPNRNQEDLSIGICLIRVENIF